MDVRGGSMEVFMKICGGLRRGPWNLHGGYMEVRGGSMEASVEVSMECPIM